jgi:hypothetical protein
LHEGVKLVQHIKAQIARAEQKGHYELTDELNQKLNTLLKTTETETMKSFKEQISLVNNNKQLKPVHNNTMIPKASNN